MDSTRLNKYISNTGYCTRRQAAALIKDGKVTVDGIVADNPGIPITEGMVVSVKGIDIGDYEPPEYYLINKPKRAHAVPTADDRGLVTLIRGVKSKRMQVLHPLAYDDTGLHVLTNDKLMIQRVSDPDNRVKAVYQIKTEPPLDEAAVEKWRASDDLKGVEVDLIEDVYYDAGFEGGVSASTEVTRWCLANQRRVLRIDRTYFAGLTKKDLPRGWSRPLTEKEVIMLKHFT